MLLKELLISIFLLSLNHSFSMENEDLTREIAKRTQPSLWKAAAKIYVGISGYYLTQSYYADVLEEDSFIKNSQLATIAYSLTTEALFNFIIWDGLQDIYTVAYNFLFDEILDFFPTRKVIGKKGIPKNFTQLTTEEKQELKILQSIRHSIFIKNVSNIIPTGLLFSTRVQNLFFLYQLGINPFSFSALDQYCKSSNTTQKLWCTPIVNTIAFALLGGIVSYNILELFNIEERASCRKGEQPLAGILNSYLVISFAQNLKQANIYQEIIRYPSGEEDLIPTINILPYLISVILNLSGSNQFYKNVFQAVSNGYNFTKERVRATLIRQFFDNQNTPVVPVETSGYQEAPPFSDRIISDFVLLNDGANSSRNYEPLIEEGINRIYKPVSEDNDSQPKKKVKTKGKPGKAKDKPEQNKKRTEIQEKPAYTSEKERARREGLERVKDLRNRSPIKITKIEKEINRLTKFLNGEIENGNGSERKLTWTLNGKDMSMNYEVPHGDDSKEYRGNKLSRVLNLLEIGYLVGVSQEQLEKYLHLNQESGLTRISKFFYYTLGERPQI